MGAMASQITSLTSVYSTVYSDADQRKIKAPRHWPLWQMASNAENVSIWWRNHDAPVIWDIMVLNNGLSFLWNPAVDYIDVTMSAMASQITSLTIVYSIVYSKRRSKKTSELRVTGLCEGKSPVTGEFPAQRASKEKNVSIWWRHHVFMLSMTAINKHVFGNQKKDWFSLTRVSRKLLELCCNLIQ